MSNRTPMQHYLDDLNREDFVEDAAQKMSVEHLQRLYQELTKPKKQDSIWARFIGADSSRIPVRGLYLWGGVGRGKTYLMDIFFDSLPFEEKQRLHFHRFMRLVHTELKSLQGEKDPLQKVADRFASKYRVLCFDEFFVSDIGDAMILATLLEAFFARGVTLVATSNVAPNSLYIDGLQRSRFLPAIDLLKKHTKVLKVDGGNDYRLRTLEQLELYHFPLGGAAENIIDTNFHRLVADEEELRADSNIEIENRPIAFRKKAEDVIWFDFEQVCGGPRSPADYIEISREFQSVLIHGVPCFDSFEIDDLARRFISLVDEFYDRSVKLVLSAEVALDQLYSGGRLSFEFERTKSRLLEMQSADYLARAHKC